MQAFLFFIICVLSTTIGAISGIGGGVIIKPVLDMSAGLSPDTLSFLSGCTVLSMSTFALINSRKAPVKVELKRGTLLASGAVAGGIIGKVIFDMVKGDSENFIGILQNSILAFLTIGVFLYVMNKEKIKGYDIHNPLFCILVGVFLGCTGAFLGIGGGPINLIVLYFFFSMNTKLAALTSIYIIFASQLSSLVSVAVTGFPEFDPLSLTVMAFGGIIGAVVGRKLAVKLSDKATDKLFIFVLFAILIICIINIVRSAILA